MKNKKSMIALLLFIIIGIIGLTIAYFSDIFSLANFFKTKAYSTTITEVFDSPENWTPGTVTPKEVYATNDGDVDVAVRVSYTEKWIPDDENSTLELTQTQVIDGVTTEVRAAEILFADDYDENWTKSTENDIDYYYYKKKLTKGNSSTSFMKAVRFNPNITSSSECTKTYMIDEATQKKIGTRITCSSTNDGYDGATYILTIKVETIQFDDYKNVWNTDVVIN